jgi:alpha,alpha-trehalose phosphorylase
MLPRTVVPLPSHLYPPDEWRIRESRFSEDHVARAETFFALSNGYLGVRGTFEGGRPALSPGTFVNGFHETWPIQHAEDAYGLARVGQTIVNVPDATLMTLYVDDEPLFMPVARCPTYERTLDMRRGSLVRELVWSTPSGRHVRIRTERLVSFEWRHLLAMRFEVTVLDHGAPVVISSKVVNRQDTLQDDSNGTFDPRQARTFSDRVLLADVVDHDGLRLQFGYRTRRSAMSLGIGVEHVVTTENQYQTDIEIDDDHGKVGVVVDAQPDVPVVLTKYAAYHTSREVPPIELIHRAGRTLDRARDAGFERVVEVQREHLDRFWSRADVRLQPVHDDGGRLQQAVRWNLFQLCQATWRAEGTGIPAKGLTGQAYEGHYFWDTEVYVIPFLAYTQPRIARNLLRFRHSMIDPARARARMVSEHGALFPWRTINGEEASANFQAGTAQYHINADIAYAIRKYVDVRGDLGFLGTVGAEILVETARLWASLGFFGADGCFHVHSVTGPDEYTTVVNDNAYTNLMARLNLNYAASTVRRLESEVPEVHAALVAELDLAPEEVEVWDRAAASMFIPYDEHQGIHPQDDSFLQREPLDLRMIPADKFPLLLHFHPLVIYRHRVIKQADIVLAMVLLGNEFSLEQKQRNFDYYDPLTTGDSSLSAAAQSIVAVEIGNMDKALEYFTYALMMDLGDVAGNVSDGVHVASTGGVWMALAFGFGGARDFDGGLSFDPRLPAAWERLEVPLRFQDRQLRVVLTHHEHRIELEEGDDLDIVIRGEHHRVRTDEPVVLDPTQGGRGGT